MSTSSDNYRERLLAAAKAAHFDWLKHLKGAVESVGGEIRSDGIQEMTALVPPCYVDDFRNLVEQIVPVGYRVTVAVPLS